MDTQSAHPATKELSRQYQVDGMHDRPEVVEKRPMKKARNVN
jgi:hypothetical protein